MDYTTIRVRAESAEALRRLARQLSAAADRTVTQTDALAAAAAYGLEHLAAVAALLEASEHA